MYAREAFSESLVVDVLTECQLATCVHNGFSHNVPNVEIVESSCRMNAFDRKTLINFITCWNAVTGHGVEGTKWRLRGLPSRSNISEESTMEVARSSSRISTQDFDDSEFPWSLCVLSSAGTAPSNSGAKPEASSKEVSTHAKPMIRFFIL